MTLLIKQIHNIHFNQIEGIIYMKIVTPAKIIVKFILLITLLTVIVVIAAFIKRDKNREEYSIAIEHLNNKEYENAIYSFNKLNGYKDSDYKILETKYNLAIQYYNDEEYTKAKELFLELVDFFDSKIYLAKIDAKINEPDISKESIYQNAISFYENENYQEAFDLFKTITDYKDSNEFISDCQARFQRIYNSHHIAAGIRNSVVITKDGTLIASGKNSFKQLNIDDWKNIVSVDMYGTLTIGLQENGVAKIVGTVNNQEIYDSEIWNNLVDIAAGEQFVVGLKFDGTVIAVGHNGDGQINVENWNNVIDVDAGSRFTVALTENKELLFTGYCNNQIKDFEDHKDEWEDVISISANGGEKGGIGKGHTVGLTSGGTLVAVGDNTYGQCDFSDTEKWSGIIKVATGDWYTVGLKSDGTVVMTGNNFENYKYIDEGILDQYDNIVDIAAGYGQTLLLTEDGEIICFGLNDDGKRDDINGCKGIMLPKD